MKKSISTDRAPSAEKILSQAIVSGGFIFVAGQVHVTPDGTLVEGSTAVKLKQVMANIEEILKPAGAGLNDVIKVTIYVTDMSLLTELNEAYPTYFEQPFPAERPSV